MESSIFVSASFKGVFWHFKVDRRILLTLTVYSFNFEEKTMISFTDVNSELHIHLYAKKCLRELKQIQNGEI